MRLALLDDAPWFGRLGAGWLPDERRLAEAYAAAHDLALVVPADLAAAVALADDPAGNDGFVADTAEAQRLRAAAAARVGENMLQGGISRIVEAGITRIGERTAATFAEPVTARAAAGALAIALHHGALAGAACGDSLGPREHRFVLAEALFSAGRWPLGRTAGGVAVF